VQALFGFFSRALFGHGSCSDAGSGGKVAMAGSWGCLGGERFSVEHVSLMKWSIRWGAEFAVRLRPLRDSRKGGHVTQALWSGVHCVVVMCYWCGWANPRPDEETERLVMPLTEVAHEENTDVLYTGAILGS